MKLQFAAFGGEDRIVSVAIGHGIIQFCEIERTQLLNAIRAGVG
jgi:hypothetical protein